MILPIVSLLLLVNVLAASGSFSYLHCKKDYGPLDPSEAAQAIDLIPVPLLNTELSPASADGRLTLNIPDAAHHVRSPVVFHFGHAIIEIEETHLWRGGQAPGRLSREEAGFFLWAEARAKALSLMASCVSPSNGEVGGWARLSVAPQGQPERHFVLRLKGTQKTGIALRNRKNKGMDVWPNLDGSSAWMAHNFSGASEY